MICEFRLEGIIFINMIAQESYNIFIMINKITCFKLKENSLNNPVLVPIQSCLAEKVIICGSIR